MAKAMVAEAIVRLILKEPPHHPGPPAIALKHLVKTYGDLTAVRDVSFAVQPGEFFGFLGPNGAGKTTTLNCIVGLASISSGSIEVFGHDVVADYRRARRLIGLSPQELNFDRYLSIRQTLIYSAGYFGIRERECRMRADELLRRFDLTSKRDLPFTKLSGGMKRRLSIARALIHEPRVLILDEPTAGVDVELRLELWEFLREINRSGLTIILTTHYIEEAQELCKKIAIINRGQIVAQEATQTIMDRLAGHTLRVFFCAPPSEHPSISGAAVEHQPGSREVTVNGIAPARISDVLGQLKAYGELQDVSVERKNLQDIFLELTATGK